MKFASLW